MAANPQTVRAQWPQKLLDGLFTPGYRYRICYGGRGGGRSWGYARALISKAWDQSIRVLCTREVQRSIKDSVHQLLADQIQAMGLERHFTITNDQIIGDNGSKFIFAGLRQQEILNIKSVESVDICWVEEGQAVSEKSWQILIPSIRRPGSEIWVTFNPGMITDSTYQRFITNTPERTRLIELSYKDNPWFPDELEAERLHCKKYDPQNYANIWEGKPRETVEGSIYHHEIVQTLEDKRVRNVPVDPMLKTHCIWDLGFNDATSVIFAQRQGSEIRIVDYLEDSHRTLDDYIHEINAKKYNLGMMYLPHDGAAKNLQTGMSPADIIRRLGMDVEVIKVAPVESGIKQARMIFRQCYFDEEKALRLLECLKRYRRNIPTSTDEPSKPVHDEFSHGADAFRMLAAVADRLSNDDYTMQPIKYDNRGIV